ncbi:oxidoreductase [Cryobacterium glaciale]|uniref:Oxidoreductase n=1 Tax=Cryobacterium glaciale TaxID=1259145 RepID=A0A4R8V502_9MICO|nr:oxidoreductase [Cryobacterium glaciale]
MGKVLITPRSITGAGVELVPELEPLRRAGYEIVAPTPGRSPSAEELLKIVPGCVGWLAGVEPISEQVLEAARELRVISRNGTGTDNIDVAAAARTGVTVVRAAGANAQAVAEMTLTLAMSCLRGVPWSAAALRAGGWQRWEAKELSDCVIGVVGLGAIGRKVASAFSALGATVIGYDPFASETGFRTVTLDDLVSQADVVTLHAPPPADGAALINAERLALFRPQSVLINTARASLVDDGAVLNALREERLGAYAVDAFEIEPPALTELLLHERVLATPHIGAFTGGSVRRATTQAVQGLLDVLTTTKAHETDQQRSAADATS